MLRFMSLGRDLKVILVRPTAEIFLKSEGVKRRWENILISEIRRVVGGAKLRRGRGRIWIENEISPECEERLRWIFGIQSYSKCDYCELQELEDRVLSFWNERVRDRSGFSFAVKVKRSGKHDFTSQEMAARIGGLILDHHPDLWVDLENPDYRIYIEIRDNDCYIFDEVIECAGGLPPGVEGKVVALFSGGVDSAVATWLMMHRGCKIIPVYFDLGAFSAHDGRMRAEKVTSFLRRYQRDLELLVISHGDFLSDIRRILSDAKIENHTCLLCKRRMYRVIEEIAVREGAKGIVTGESLGQVASQTLDNLFILDHAVKIPVFRPLIGLDKNRIEAMARAIGVYDVCTSMKDECLATPDKPTTKGNLQKILEVESNKDI